MSDLGFESNCKHVKSIAKNTENMVKATHKAIKALEAAANAIFEVSSALSEFASMHNVNPIIRGDVEQLHNRLRLFHGGQSIGQLKMNEQRDVEWPAKEMSKNVEKVLSLASTRRDEADRVKKYAKDLNKMDKYQQHILQLNQHDLSFQCAVTDLNMHAEVLLHKFINSFTQSHTNFLLDLGTSLQPGTQCTANAIRANNYININNKDDYNNMNCNSKNIIFGNTNNNMVSGNSGTCTSTEPLPPNSFITNMNSIHTNNNNNQNVPINANVSDVQIHCNVNNDSVNRAQSLSSNSYCQRTPSTSMPRSEPHLPKNMYNNYPQNVIATSHATRETASYSPSQIVSHNQPSNSQTMPDYPNDYNTTQPAQIPIYATPPQKQDQIQTMQSKCDLRQQQFTQNQNQQHQQLQKELHGPMISVFSTPTVQQREVDRQVAHSQEHPSQNFDHCNSNNMHRTNNNNNNNNKITITNKDKKKLNSLINNIKNNDAQRNMEVESTSQEHATQVAKRGTAFPATCKTNNVISTANNTNKTLIYANNNYNNNLLAHHQQHQHLQKQQLISTNNQCNIVV